jgi:type I restriction enzyme S subunit
LFYLLLTKRNDILSLQTGSAQGGVNLKSIKNLEAFFPNHDEQKEIADILSDMDTEIVALETKLEKYKKLKIGMMQNLLTGKIRLTNYL